MSCSGYAGYRPYATRESLLASPPGVTSQIHSKFRHDFTATIPDAAEAGLSMMGKAGAESANAAALAFQSSTLLRAPTADASKTRSAANSVSRSIYGAEMANYYTEGPQLRACSEEELRTAFSLVAEKVTGAAEADRLPISAVRRVLSAALHQEPSRRQAEALEAALAAAGGGSFSVDDLVSAAPAAADSLDRVMEAQRPTQKHAGARAAPRGGDATFGGVTLVGPLAHSAYQADLGVPGHDPRHRPLCEPVASGTFQTTADLSRGTTRSSKHPPGYGGHVPSTLWGAVAEQGLGASERDFFHSKTNLSATFLRRVPGYAGHVPDFVSAGTAPGVTIPQGQFAPTSSVRADFAVQQYWAARKAAAGAR